MREELQTFPTNQTKWWWGSINIELGLPELEVSLNSLHRLIIEHSRGYKYRGIACTQRIGAFSFPCIFEGADSYTFTYLQTFNSKPLQKVSSPWRTRVLCTNITKNSWRSNTPPRPPHPRIHSLPLPTHQAHHSTQSSGSAA